MLREEVRKETQIKSQPHRDDWQLKAYNKWAYTDKEYIYKEKIVTERPLGELDFEIKDHY